MCLRASFVDCLGEEPLAAATPEELAILAPDWEDAEEHAALNGNQVDGTDDLELLAEYNASYRELTGE